MIGAGSEEDRPDKLRLVAGMGIMSREDLYSAYPDSKEYSFRDKLLVWDIVENLPGAILENRQFLRSLVDKDKIEMQGTNTGRKAIGRMCGVRLFYFDRGRDVYDFIPSLALVDLAKGKPDLVDEMGEVLNVSDIGPRSSEESSRLSILADRVQLPAGSI